MPRAFLKKKSLYDRFKDEHGHTNPIKAMRAGHQWSNPIIRHKREKGANAWIKSFQGRKHVRKLSRFNAMLEEGKVDELVCKYYGNTLEFPDGTKVKVYPSIATTKSMPANFVVTGAMSDFPGPYGFALYGYGKDIPKYARYTVPGRLLCKDGHVLKDYFINSDTGMSAYNMPTRFQSTYDKVIDRLVELYTDDELEYISDNYDVADDVESLHSVEDIVQRINDWFASNYN